MKKRDLKVGMKVRIKSWEDMKKGVGLEIDDYEIYFPYCVCSFTTEMKYLCGRTAAVKKIGSYIELDFDNKNDNPNQWHYIPQMLEPVVEEGKISGVTKFGEPIETKPTVCNLKISEPIETTEEPFTKEDLTLGMVVELRNGYICIVDGEGCISINLELILRHLKDLHNVTYLYNYKDNLLNNNYLGGTRGFDIMKVYEDYTLNNLLWERKEIKLSEREIEVLKACKIFDYKVIARDSNGKLYVYKTKEVEKNTYDTQWIHCAVLPEFHLRLEKFEDLFQFVKWEDEKPYSIEELLSYES